MKIRLTPRRAYIPTIVFILCIVIQLRILFVVPQEKENRPCDERNQVGRKMQEISKVIPSETVQTNMIYEEWLAEFKNPLIGVKLTKNITKFLITGTSMVKNSSRSFEYFSEEAEPRLVSIGILMTESGLIENTFKTMDTLLEDNAGEDRKKFRIILQLSMRDADLGAKVFGEVMKRYGDFFDTGQVHIVHGPAELYHRHGIPKETDADMRKEILDHALLFLYSRNLAKYFVQLEPGIVCERFIIRNILKIVSRQKAVWFGIDFGHFGFIGTLFHSTFLQSMAEYLASRFRIENINVLLRQLYLTISKRSVTFTNSSPCLHHDIERLKSRFRFDRGDNTTLLKGDNPPAVINTTMETFGGYSPIKAYDNDNSTFFWASSVGLGDNFRLIFRSTVNLTRVIVTTGGENGEKDRLISGYLRVGTNYPPCSNLIRRGVFVRGYVDTIEQGLREFPSDINCLSIDVTRPQRQWLVIRDIKIFTRKADT
ncbi:alpha-1,3-mannosyl-glycoprotein 4-beta-N-acetylglucosaminyltransferase C-like [Mizuhopecten yessoensis]|uniref:Alpha-1,3-mannosyl-glycoprotein 4-beta-N-acetylglucosaminyltransferase C n=1 Tax=Mizuhopecten yessoensis TaxID=6573 RepID=A0A210PV87_MIZYE|nr:alpha-1,3-mannosyl-glycoprotein 4-beta-N-acetylglucosaminyltransferase C-like [Mizuhopecten yessoensis]XP_021374495.1 alpha-1,3-mannosyl-glycoprotein 4-beta-N-acetylglucosaminyltransferase C-like [Mizuhopecten yessoensis]OWF40376.1 Alpha-1,3-mannosyl-glycoprotein 4-beta-N-acetylglucosaminyltransferase C [Mizuhopecten yessoensis]